jgi:hypothetical protein
MPFLLPEEVLILGIKFNRVEWERKKKEKRLPNFFHLEAHLDDITFCSGN